MPFRFCSLHPLNRVGCVAAFSVVRRLWRVAAFADPLLDLSRSMSRQPKEQKEKEQKEEKEEKKVATSKAAPDQILLQSRAC